MPLGNVIILLITHVLKLLSSPSSTSLVFLMMLLLSDVDLGYKLILMVQPKVMNTRHGRMVRLEWLDQNGYIKMVIMYL